VNTGLIATKRLQVLKKHPGRWRFPNVGQAAAVIARFDFQCDLLAGWMR